MLVASGVLIGAAQFMKGKQAASTAASSTDERLLPDFAAQINDVESVRIEKGDASFTLARSEDGWGIAEKGGFPVDTDKVRKLLVAFQEARILEEKTSNEAYYERLGVEGPKSDSDSSRVTAVGAGGTELAALIIGKQRENKGGAMNTDEAHYVRRGDEPESWLVSGKLAIDSSEGQWLAKELLDIERERVRAVEIQHAGGERVFVAKPDKTATDWELQEIPEGKELRYASVANSLGSGLARLNLDDVVASDAFTFDNPAQATATFWTFDGLKIVVTSQEADDKLYATVEASYDPDAPPGLSPLDMGPPVAQSEEDEATGDGDAEADEATAPDAAEEGPTPEEVEAEAAELTARSSGWTFILPSWKKSTFQKKLEDLVKDIPAPTDPSTAVEGGIEIPDLAPAAEEPGEDPAADSAEDAEPLAEDAADVPDPASQPEDPGVPPEEDPEPIEEDEAEVPDPEPQPEGSGVTPEEGPEPTDGEGSGGGAR